MSQVHQCEAPDPAANVRCWKPWTDKNQEAQTPDKAPSEILAFCHNLWVIRGHDLFCDLDLESCDPDLDDLQCCLAAEDPSGACWSTM